MAKKCNIKGTIISNGAKWIYDWLGIEATAPKDIEKVLDDANGEDVEFAINSGGGDVYAGSEMFTLIKKYPGDTTAEVLGIAASAASLPLCAVKTARISPTAQIMIHNAASGARGDHRAMQHSADVLKGWNDSISNAYMMKTGMSKEALLELMNQETWLTAEKALEMKFVNEIMFTETSNSIVNAVSDSAVVIPEEVVNKLQNLLANLALKEGSLPSNMDDYRQQILNSVKKGDVTMDLEQILASLPEDQRTVVTNAIEASKTEGKKEAEANFAEEKQTLQNKINTLENTNEENEEALLANVDPKIKAMIENAKQKEAEAKAASLAAQNELQEVKNQKELKEYTDVAASFDKLPINAAEFGPIFRNFAKADKDGYTNLVALLKASNECVEKGKLFNSIGSQNTPEGGSAWDQMQNLVNDMMKQNPTMTNHQALTEVIKNNTELYEQYVAEMNGNGSEE